MKFVTTLTVLASAVSFCSAVPAATNANAPATLEPIANGLYITTFDAAGNEVVEFTPESELYNNTAVPALGERSEGLEKRREGCGAYVPTAESDEANRLLLQRFNGNNVVLGGGKVSYAHNTAISFICVYSGGQKPKTSIAGTWDWVKRVKCGRDRGGYGQVLDGSGDWTAGYTFNGDRFC
ncbi:hypothetical protein B0T20DRAFT_509560 [Sordaria brevicollis]|uniref:Uncharacterized protein n=1 Tax=Sordaria brevicollis TaxID=83679 RepID=A0AAE0P9I8_SORBR|nr:hypothetical protein B0T20DRAFT_509560 [Sordaria brevicollis]